MLVVIVQKLQVLAPLTPGKDSTMSVRAMSYRELSSALTILGQPARLECSNQILSVLIIFIQTETFKMTKILITVLSISPQGWQCFQ